MLIKNTNELLIHHIYYCCGYNEECIRCIAVAGKDGYIWMKSLYHTHEKYYDPNGFIFIGEFPDDMDNIPDKSYTLYNKANENIKITKILTAHDIDLLINKTKSINKPHKKQKNKKKNRQINNWM